MTNDFQTIAADLNDLRGVLLETAEIALALDNTKVASSAHALDKVVDLVLGGLIDEWTADLTARRTGTAA